MIETDEATELERLQAKKLADARHALRAYEEAWEAYLHAREQHGDRLKEHAARVAAFRPASPWRRYGISSAMATASS